MEKEVEPRSDENEKGRLLRPLGTFERFRAVLHDLGFHNNVSIVATYSGAPISRELLVSALKFAVVQHPALSVTLSGKSLTSPHFVSLEEIDLPELISFVNCPADPIQRREQIDAILSEQHSLGFDLNGLPLWRVIAFNLGEIDSSSATDIAFIWHHVIGDGASGLAVHSSILQALNSPLSIANEHDKEMLQSNSLVSIAIPRKPLSPSMEEIFSLPRSLSLKISTLLHTWLPWRYRQRNLKKWSGGAYHCDPPIKTRIRHVSIPAASLKTLLQLCRQENTTITPFLQSLVGRTICETFEDARRLRCAIAISLRRFIPSQLQVHDDAMGLWVSAFHVEYTRSQLLRGRKDERHFWDEARKNSRRIQQEIKKGDRDLSTGMLRYIPDFRGALVSKMGKKRDDSFAITNLGNFDADESLDASSKAEGSAPAQFRISDLFFSQSCHVNGSALQFCIVSVKNGDLNIALSWQEGTVQLTDVERVERNLKSGLEDFCNQMKVSKKLI